MKLNKNILYIVNELQQTCGITASLFSLLSGFNESADKCTVVCGGGDAVEKFRDLGAEVIADDSFLHQKRNMRRFLLAHVRLFGIVKKKNIDIVHSHHFYSAAIAWNLKRILDYKTIFSCHGLIPETGKLNHFKADHIIAVNDHIYDFILKNRIKDESNVHLIRCGMRIQKSAEKKTGRTGLRFFAASRLEYDKGMDIFINAVAALPERYLTKAEFSFAGRGSCLPELLKLAETTGSKVKYLGNLPGLKKVLEKNDVFVMPSRSVSEGFPLAVVEAAMSGNLVISSGFLGSDSLIENMQNALVFSSGDYCDLAAKITYTIDNYTSLIPFAANLKAKVDSLFDIDITSREILKLYSDITEENIGSRRSKV